MCVRGEECEPIPAPAKHDKSQLRQSESTQRGECSAVDGFKAETILERRSGTISDQHGAGTAQLSLNCVGRSVNHVINIQLITGVLSVKRII